MNLPAAWIAEPTGSLDSESSAVVMQALKDVQRQMGTTVIVVTHNMEIAAQMDRLVTLVDGHITSDVEGDESVEMAALKLFKQKRLTGEMSAVKA